MVADIKLPKIGLPKGGSKKSQDVWYNVLMIVIVSVIAYVLYQIYLGYKTLKSIPEEIINIPSEIAKQTKESMVNTSLNIIPELSGYNATKYKGNDPAAIAAEQQATAIQKAAYKAGVNAQYQSANIVEKGSLFVDKLFGGGAYTNTQTANQRIINALLPDSFGGNAGYIERWISSMSYGDANFTKLYTEGKTDAEIRASLSPEFKKWLQINFDANGNQINTTLTTQNATGLTGLLGAVPSQIISWFRW